jgi:hypothetical protein
LRDTDLRALRDKYERMLRLRLLHMRAKAEPDFVEPDPRAAMAELARAFPGALREIDDLPLEVIRARITEIAAAETDPERAASWMNAHVSFHRLARGALLVKRWLGGRSLDAALAATFGATLAVMSAADREDASAWARDLEAIATPPRGRVMDLVYERLARELDVDVAVARAAIMPSRVPASARARLLRRG